MFIGLFYLPTAYGLNRYSLLSDSCGIRTRPGWLERPATSPEVERAVFGYVGAHLKRSYSQSVFASNAFSGLGGARTLLSGSSGQRYTVSATSP